SRQTAHELSWRLEFRRVLFRSAPDTAAQILHLAVDLRAEVKSLDQGIGAARCRHLVESLEARVGKQIVFHGQEQLYRRRLNHRKIGRASCSGSAADVWLRDDVE